MQYHSIRSSRHTGEIVDLLTLDTLEGECELGILTLRTAHHELKTCYAEGRALKSAVETLFPTGWRGQRCTITLESHNVVCLECAP